MNGGGTDATMWRVDVRKGRWCVTMFFCVGLQIFEQENKYKGGPIAT